MSKIRVPKRDEQVDVARTIYWFACLRLRLGTDKPREIQRIVAPETVGLDPRNEPIKNNKFLGYSKGEHVPNSNLVQRAARLSPRSAQALEHPLWKVLRAKGSIRKMASQWIRQLDREIQGVALGHFNDVVTGANRHTLGALERRAGLDSLAALTILLKLRHEESQPECAWLYALSIFRVLLIIGPELDQHEVAEKVFDLYVQRVFGLASINQQRIDLTTYPYMLMTDLLERLVVNVIQKSSEERSSTYYALGILNGVYKSRLHSLFEIPVTPAQT